VTAAKERQNLGAPVQVIVQRKPDGDEVSQLVGARDSTILVLQDVSRRGVVRDGGGLSRGGSPATHQRGERRGQRRAVVVDELREEAGHGGPGHRRQPIGQGELRWRRWKKSTGPLRGTKVQRPRCGLRARVAGRRHPREWEWDQGWQITRDGSGGRRGSGGGGGGQGGQGRWGSGGRHGVGGG
jgi:hypothetical protein